MPEVPGAFGSGRCGYAGDLPAAGIFPSHLQMHFGLAEMVLSQEHVDAVQDLRRGKGQFLHGAGIRAADQQDAAPVSDGAGNGGKLASQHGIPLAEQQDQAHAQGVHAARGEPAAEGIAKAGDAAAHVEAVSLKTPAPRLAAPGRLCGREGGRSGTLLHRGAFSSSLHKE